MYSFDAPRYVYIIMCVWVITLCAMNRLSSWLALSEKKSGYSDSDLNVYRLIPCAECL